MKFLSLIICFINENFTLMVNSIHYIFTAFFVSIFSIQDRLFNPLEPSKYQRTSASKRKRCRDKPQQTKTSS